MKTRNERRNLIGLIIGLGIVGSPIIYGIVKLISLIPNPDSIVF